MHSTSLYIYTLNLKLSCLQRGFLSELDQNLRREARRPTFGKHLQEASFLPPSTPAPPLRNWVRNSGYNVVMGAPRHLDNCPWTIIDIPCWVHLNASSVQKQDLIPDIYRSRVLTHVVDRQHVLDKNRHADFWLVNGTHKTDPTSMRGFDLICVFFVATRL
jgi:hypothetical protein